MGRTTRSAARILAALVVLLAVLVGPSTYFYVRYLRADTVLPPVTVDTGESRSAPELDPELAVQLRDAVASARQKVGAPSFSAAIAFDGQVQWAGTVGYSDVAAREPASLSSRYRLGSTSKALTGALLMRLVQDGTIDLDAPIASHVDGLPPAYAQLTPRQLASHTSGVRHYSWVPTYWPGSHPGMSGKHYESVEAGLSIFLDDPLEFPPGESFGYSTYGYSLLSRVLEGASGASFPELLQDRLFSLLEMHDTSCDLPGELPERVSYYVTDDGKFTEAYPSGASYKLAGGGILASASDVARFGLALLGEDYLDADGTSVLFEPVTLADGSDNPQNYALGFRVDTSVRLLGEARPTLIVHHGGTQNGGSSFFMMLPEHGISVSTLANSGAGAVRGEAQELAYELTRAVIAARDEAAESEPP